MEVAAGYCPTIRQFRDFRLHVEFLCPNEPHRPNRQRGNSGVYLLGRYEVQIRDSWGVSQPGTHDCGALCWVRAPDLNACHRPGHWQTYDITFRAPRFDASGEKTANARVSVVHNGRSVHTDVELVQTTDAARGIRSPRREEVPAGPIELQNHLGSQVRFRNIWLVPTDGAAPETQPQARWIIPGPDGKMVCPPPPDPTSEEA